MMASKLGELSLAAAVNLADNRVVGQPSYFYCLPDAIGFLHPVTGFPVGSRAALNEPNPSALSHGKQ
jgi:hypothetical protein